MKINISVIIPVYQSKDTLKRAINSINEQKIKIKDIKIEIIIIIDDGQNYKNIIPKVRKGIVTKIIKSGGIKTGPGNTRNKGIKKAKGKYLAFLDADDEWSENYIENMYKLAKLNGISFAPTEVCIEEGKKIKFTGIEDGFLQLSDIGNVPCSFHPVILKSKQKYFKNLISQDVYNTAYILAKENKKIKMISEGCYKLNVKKQSVTNQKGFNHKIELAYKKYQIICGKENMNNISKQFSLRRIINKKYMNSNKKKRIHFYSYLESIIYEVQNEKN